IAVLAANANAGREQKPPQMPCGAPRLDRGGTEPRHACMRLEPAAVCDAVVDERQQQRMTQLRQRAALSRACAFTGRIEVRDRHPDGLSCCEIQHAAFVAEEAFRKEARHPRATQCKKMPARFSAEFGRARARPDQECAETSYRIFVECCVFSPRANPTAARSSSFSRAFLRDSPSIKTPSRASSIVAKGDTGADAGWRLNPIGRRSFPGSEPERRSGHRSR